MSAAHRARSASADAPEPQANFCLVGSQSSNNSISESLVMQLELQLRLVSIEMADHPLECDAAGYMPIAYDFAAAKQGGAGIRRDPCNDILHLLGDRRWPLLLTRSRERDCRAPIGAPGLRSSPRAAFSVDHLRTEFEKIRALPGQSETTQ